MKFERKFLLFLLLCGAFLQPVNVRAELLKDLNILQLKKTAKGVKVKVSQVGKQKNNYFYVLIDKKDPRRKKIYKFINLKKKLKDKYQLSMNIPSFSTFPYGSFYSSLSLKITGQKKSKDKSSKLPPRGF